MEFRYKRQQLFPAIIEVDDSGEKLFLVQSIWLFIGRDFIVS
ncbi:hypothetical protein C5L29_001823 [Lactiplantibacillus pentosus]|nr:hypothetical protein C5L29_001823 [Lactiplantibacillus pentosus]